jgi:hypothetical protein
MSDHWYCLIAGREYGPFTSQQLREFVIQGRLTQEHFVRPATSGQWLSPSQVSGLFPVPPVPMRIPDAPLNVQPSQAPIVPSGPQPVAAVPGYGPVMPAIPQQATEVPMVPTARPVGPMVPDARPMPGMPTTQMPMGPMVRAPDGGALHPGWPAPGGAPRAVPVSQPVPVGAPLGVPVGAPVGVPMAAPVGRPCGTAVPPAASHVPSPNQERLEVRRKIAKAHAQNLVLIVGCVAGGVLLVGVLIAVSMVMSSSGLESRVRQVDAAASAKKPETPHAGGAEKGTKKGAKSAALRAPSLAQVQSWQELAPNRKIGGGLRNIAQVLLNGAWRDAGSRLNIELRVQNVSSDTLEFRPWRPGAEPSDPLAVVAVDDRDQPLRPAHPGGSVPRQMRPKEIVTERLVYEMPSDGFEAVRLVLSFAAFGQREQIGFKIPRSAVGDAPPSDLPPLLPGGRPGGQGTDPILDLKVDGGAPAFVPPMEGVTLPDGPPRATPPAETEKKAEDPMAAKPAEDPAAEKKGENPETQKKAEKKPGQEDDEDLEGLMNEEEKPAANQPPEKREP